MSEPAYREQGATPITWPTIAQQVEYWERKEQEWVGCNGGENDWRWDEQQYSNFEGHEL